MKAMVWTRYGPPDVLQLRELETPTPKEKEVRVRVHASTVTAGDCELRGLKGPPYLSIILRLYAGLSRPRRITILGQELAGEIDSVGKDVTRFKSGDQVFAWTGLRLGAYAEYACLPEKAMLGIKPSNLGYEEAAALPVGGLESLHFLGNGNVRPGDKVLINGAGGSIGTFGLQLARHYGAEVTAVDSAEKLEVLRSLGADHIIDFAREDFTRNGETYDVIFDVIGKAPFSRAVRSLKPDGRYLLGNPSLSHRFRGRWSSLGEGRKAVFGASDHSAAELLPLKELVEAGTIRPVIDRRYPLEELPDAHRYVEAGHKKGNVVITIS
jgi:NADPH:quinone reductase-like Zn-dependent oxidoreductase